MSNPTTSSGSSGSSGMAAAQSAGQHAATAMRTSHKGRHWKLIFWAVTFCIVLVLLATWREYRTRERSQQNNAATQPGKAGTSAVMGPGKNLILLRWEKLLPDGTVPKEVWSEPLGLTPGCSHAFYADKEHQVQYRYQTAEWKDYVPGTSPDMDAIRQKATKEGFTPFGIITTCK